MRSEAAVQQAVRLEAPRQGCTLWRNNNGACQTSDGRQIRYGLANDSAQMNAKIKSSDLIGITRVVITPEMVGQTVGVFTSFEIKREGWVYAGTPREKAQWEWIKLIIANGGFGGFAQSPADIWPGTSEPGGR